MRGAARTASEKRALSSGGDSASETCGESTTRWGTPWRGGARDRVGVSAILGSACCPAYFNQIPRPPWHRPPSSAHIELCPCNDTAAPG